MLCFCDCRPVFSANLDSSDTQYQISVLVDGQVKTFNVPAALVEQVRQKIELRRRFEAAAAAICNINLRRYLKQKEKP